MSQAEGQVATVITNTNEVRLFREQLALRVEELAVEIERLKSKLHR
jgi:hypothetical protein